MICSRSKATNRKKKQLKTLRWIQKHIANCVSCMGDDHVSSVGPKAVQLKATRVEYRT